MCTNMAIITAPYIVTHNHPYISSCSIYLCKSGLQLYLCRDGDMGLYVGCCTVALFVHFVYYCYPYDFYDFRLKSFYYPFVPLL